MAFTGSPVNSTQYASQIAENAKPSDVNSKMRVAFFSYTHAAGAGTGEINLVKLPAGKIRVFSDLSRAVCSQMAANADLHIGFRAYTEQDGDSVSEDDNAFLDNGDSGGGALDGAFVLPTDGYKDFDSKNGVIIFAMVDTGNIENDDTIHGWVAFQQGN